MYNSCFFLNTPVKISSVYMESEHTAGSKRMMSHDNNIYYVKFECCCILHDHMRLNKNHAQTIYSDGKHNTIYCWSTADY